MEEELLEKTDFIYRKTVLYYYNGWYYEPIDAEGVVALYRQYISPGLDGVKNLRNHMDIYRCLKADSRLKYEDSLKDKPYCPLKNGILYKQVLSDLIDKEELFWTNHVVPQIPPAPNGCDCDTQKINQLYEVDDRDKTADLSALHTLILYPRFCRKPPTCPSTPPFGSTTT